MLTQPLEARAAVPPWPIVLYFHHVGNARDHYTSISFNEFVEAINLIQDVARIVPSPMADSASHSGEEVQVMLSFDDGYKETIDRVVPFLLERRLGATFFVSTSSVGSNSHHVDLGALAHASWEDLRALAGAGMSVGSHGHRHVPYDELSLATARSDAATSMALIEQQLALPPFGFAYPFGRIAAGTFLNGHLPVFGTIRSRATPWPGGVDGIRRVYLPTGRSETWSELLRVWIRSYRRRASRNGGDSNHWSS